MIELRDVLLVGTGVAAGVLAFAAWQHAKSRSASQSTKNVVDGSRPALRLETVHVEAEALEAFAAAVFVSHGVPTEDAATAARTLVLADLRGIDSHGIARLRAYHRMLQEGLINARPKIRIVSESESTATIDGGNGLGLVVAAKANEICMAKAAKAGSGWVAVKNTNHFGIAGAYALQAVERGMIGIALTNSSAVVAPLFGKQRFLGTNPIAIAFPAEHEKPIVIDLATSVVPWGKVEEYARLGQPLLPGWAIDEHGQHGGGSEADGGSGAEGGSGSTHGALDPEKVLATGALMNLGGTREHSGHKGFCLAAMVDILSAVLAGGNWGPTVDGFTTSAANYGAPDASAAPKTAVAAGQQPSGDGESSAEATSSPSEEEERATGIGHFLGALRIDAFRNQRAFRRTIDTWARTFRGCEPCDPAQPVQVPGDPEWRAMERRAKSGIPVKLAVLADLRDIALDMRLEPPFDVDAVDLSGVRRVAVDRA